MTLIRSATWIRTSNRLLPQMPARHFFIGSSTALLVRSIKGLLSVGTRNKKPGFGYKKKEKAVLNKKHKDEEQ